jgi:hypothetical protein
MIDFSLVDSARHVLAFQQDREIPVVGILVGSNIQVGLSGDLDQGRFTGIDEVGTDGRERHCPVECPGIDKQVSQVAGDGSANGAFPCPGWPVDSNRLWQSHARQLCHPCLRCGSRITIPGLLCDLPRRISFVSTDNPTRFICIGDATPTFP